MNKLDAVFCDVDGTLMNSSYEISPLTLSAIKQLIKKGIRFVIISARSPSGILHIPHGYGFACPVIAYSGALMMDEKGEILFNTGMSVDAASAVIDYASEEGLDISWCIYSVDRWLVDDPQDERIRKESDIVKIKPEKGTLAGLEKDAPVNKLLCICEAEDILDIENKLKIRFPELSIVKSDDTLLEVMKNGVSKSIALKRFCSINGMDEKNVAAFGDNYNDEDMLLSCGYGFLMGNAPDELKQRIPRITRDKDNDGIYYALKGLGVVE